MGNCAIVAFGRITCSNARLLLPARRFATARCHGRQYTGQSMGCGASTPPEGADSESPQANGDPTHPELKRTKSKAHIRREALPVSTRSISRVPTSVEHDVENLPTTSTPSE